MQYASEKEYNNKVINIALPERFIPHGGCDELQELAGISANKIAESLYVNDYKKLQKAIAEYMDRSISFYDAGAEGFYHGLTLGLIALMDNQYKIKSNRESGDGRYDISLLPRENQYPGIIIELKWKSNLSEEKLEG